MKFNKPQVYLFTTAILIILFGLITYDAESVIDINLHDTYYVIDSFLITEFIVTLLILAGVFYWIYQKANRKLNKALTKIHLIITIGGLFIYPILAYLLNSEEINSIETLNIILAIIILIVFIAQILFLINLIIGLFKNNKYST